MVDLSMLLDDEDLRRRYGAQTLERGLDYARRGKVLQCAHEVDYDGDLDIRGTVAGSTPAPYTVYVSVGLDGQEPWVYSRCSCPVRDGCKHAVALLLTVRGEHERESPRQGARVWERQLGSLLDELDDAVEDVEASASKPLALQIELKPPTSSGYRGWNSQFAPKRGTLRIRPLQKGARGQWVRTGISWQQVPGLDARRGYPKDQVAALSEMLTGYRTATRQTYLGAETHLPVASFGAGLWELLRRLEQAGVPLVPDKGLERVRVSPDPVTLELDVNAAPGGDAQLRPGVSVEDEWYGAADLDVLGEAGHGVALWQPADRGWALTLAPLSSPLGPAVRRLLRQGSSVVIPAADRDDLVSEYLPRLHRHVPVTSSDGSVPVPDPPEPRLALTVTWAAVDEVSIAWNWRYRVGEDDRVYDLSDTRGMRGVRRPDAERELLEKLELDDDQVHYLCRARQRDLGLEDRRTFRDGGAIAFAEDVLPGLRDQVEVDEIGRQPDYREAHGAPVVRFDALEGGLDQEGADAAGETRTDWLDLEVIISVDGHFIALSHLLKALTMGRDRIILRNGVHVRLDRPEFAHLAELVQAAGELQEQPRDGVRVGHHDLGLWDELAEVGIVDAQAQQWVSAARALRDLDSLPELDPVG